MGVSANYDARNSQENQDRLENDPYDRYSFDSKVQAVHRSAMINKNNPALLPKGGMDSIGLHQAVGVKNMHGNSAVIENHYLPNISPNYTSGNQGMSYLQKDGANGVIQTSQNSSRTLAPIPHLVQHNSHVPSSLHTTNQYSPS